MNSKLKRFLTLFVVLALAGIVMVACDGNNDEVGLVDDADIVVDEGAAEPSEIETDPDRENPPVGDESAIGEDIGALDEIDEDTAGVEGEAAEIETDPARENPPVGDDEEIGESIQALDELGQQAEQPGTLVSASRFLDLQVLGSDGTLLGETDEAYFSTDGNIQYVGLNLEDVGLTEFGTTYGDVGTFDAGFNTVIISWDALEVVQDPAMLQDATLSADMETPTTLALRTDMAADTSIVVETYDPNLVEDDGLFVNPATLDIQDPDFAFTGAQELFQMGRFADFEISDYDVVNSVDEELGGIDNLIVDVMQGTVAYATVDVGGFLDIGETEVVVPWNQFAFDASTNNFVLNIDQTTLQQAPIIAGEDMDTGLFDAGVWEQSVDPFWETM